MRNESSGLRDLDIKDDESILGFVKNIWEHKDDLVGGLHQRWLKTIACYMGFYHLKYEEAAKRFKDLTKDWPSWRTELAINLHLPRARTQAAKLLRVRPTFDVIPGTLDVQDIEVAEAAKKSLQGYFYQKNINHKIIDLVMWIVLTGNGYLASYWDPFKGPYHQVSPQDFINPQDLQMAMSSQNPTILEAIIASAQNKMKNFRRKNGDGVFLGEVWTQVLSPFGMLHSRGVQFDETDWMIYGQIRDKSYYDQLGIDIDEFEGVEDKDKRYLNLQSYTDVMASFDSTNIVGSNSTQEGICEDVLELQFRLPCSQRHKNGFWATIAGGKVIAKGPNPYRHRTYGIAHFYAEKIPGKIEGMSAVEQSTSSIEAYNKALSKLHEQFNLMSQPKWLVPTTAGIPSNKITSQPGQVIRYSGMLKPEPMKMPEPSSAYEQIMSHSIRDIDEITAQREASRGINPSGGRSAAVVKTLQTTDEGSLNIIGLVLNTGFGYWGRITLTVMDQFYTEDRLITYTGQNNEHISLTFKKGSLVGPNANRIGIDYFNVRVNSYTQFGLDRQGQIEVLNSFLQYGIWGPENRGDIMKWLDVGHFEDEIDQFKVDRSVAHRENLMMSQGQLVPTLNEQHHATHIKEHKRYLNAEGKKLPMQVQQIIRQHIFLTEMNSIKEAVKPQILQKVAVMQVINEVSQNIGIEPEKLLGVITGGESTKQPEQSKPQPAAAGK